MYFASGVNNSGEEKKDLGNAFSFNGRNKICYEIIFKITLESGRLRVSRCQVAELFYWYIKHKVLLHKLGKVYFPGSSKPVDRLSVSLSTTRK
jgi:hypothetical protein